MKILAILNDHLLPITNGYNLRIFNLLSRLAKSNDIEVISYEYFGAKHAEIGNNPFKSNITCKRENGKGISYKYQKLKYLNILVPPQNMGPSSYSKYDESLDKIIEMKLKKNNYDVILCYGAPNYIYYLNKYGIDNVICDVIDSSSLFIWSIIKNAPMGSKKWFIALNKLFYNIAWERRYLNKCNKIITISELDKKWQSRSVKKDKIVVIGNGVDLDYFQPKYVNPGIDKDLIVFTGVMNYEPNNDAMVYCIKEIWPLIIKRNAKAKMRIIGRNPLEELILAGKNANNIEITGEVKDIRKEVMGARLFLCPMRIGAGMKNKIIEALSMGIPVVANRKAVEGNEFPDGKVGFMEDNKMRIAEIIGELSSNNEKWKELSKNARNFAIKHFNWDDKAGQLFDVINNVRNNQNKI